MSLPRCPRCGTANRVGSLYCNACGERLDAEVSITTCPNCGVNVPAYSLYCHRCGAKLPQAAPIVNPPPPITEGAAGEGEPPAESDVISLDQMAQPVLGAEEAAPAPFAEAAPAALLPETIPGEPAPEATPLLPPAVSLQPAPETPVTPFLRVRPPLGPPAEPVTVPRQGRGGETWRLLLYLALAGAIVVGVLFPRGLSDTTGVVSPDVRALYDAVEALPPGATVVLSFDYEPSTVDEMQPLASAITRHLVQKRAHILAMSLLPQGPALAQTVLEQAARAGSYQYGPDYVNLGFLAGDEAALATLGGNLASAFSSDFVRGQDVSSFAAVQAMPRIGRADLIIDIAAGDVTVRRWVEQVQSRQKVRLAAATSAMATPMTFPYVQSGQLVGLAGGLPAAAQYEQLLGYEGPATRGMTAQSLGHLVLLLAILIANLWLIASPRRSAR